MAERRPEKASTGGHGGIAHGALLVSQDDGVAGSAQIGRFRAVPSSGP